MSPVMCAFASWALSCCIILTQVWPPCTMMVYPWPWTLWAVRYRQRRHSERYLLINCESLAQKGPLIVKAFYHAYLKDRWRWLLLIAALSSYMPQTLIPNRLHRGRPRLRFPRAAHKSAHDHNHNDNHNNDHHAQEDSEKWASQRTHPSQSSLGTQPRSRRQVSHFQWMVLNNIWPRFWALTGVISLTLLLWLHWP